MHDVPHGALSTHWRTEAGQRASESANATNKLAPRSGGLASDKEDLVTTTNNPNSHNLGVIEEFRANEGKVGGRFEGSPVLLLGTTGAKSGAKRTNPMMYQQEDGRIFVFASKGGAPTSPDWYHNLVANPAVTVEIGTEKYEATAAALGREERDSVYAAWVERFSFFGDYEKKAGGRTIPVVELTRNS
jgi:deazaflavin-dependent oxidoreductase (nitroreductase family)